MDQHTSPKRKRGMASAPSFSSQVGAAFLLLAGLFATGCNDATPDGGVAARPTVTAIPDDEAALCARIDNVRAENSRRYMNTRDHAAWQLVHGILAYQDQLKIRSAPDSKEPPFPALKYLLEGGDVRGFTLEPREPEIAFKLHGADGFRTREYVTDRAPTDAERLVGNWVLSEINEGKSEERELLRGQVRELEETLQRAPAAYIRRDILLEAVRAERISVLRDAPTLATVVEGGSKSGQGHPNQWLGYLLVDYPPPEGRQASVTKDTRVIYRDPAGNTKTYTIADMIREAKMALRQGDECGWSLIGLTAFRDVVPLDEPWPIPRPDAREGEPKSETWSIERILEMECDYGKDEGFHSSSCGGTHRLIGLSLAVQRYQKFRHEKGLPDTLTGGWAKAQEMVDWGVERIRQLQQEDGAFSAQWLQRPGMSSDVAVRMRTTGHCLEFLALTLSDKQLAQDWVTRAAVHLCELFEQTKELPLDCGATYHALHGLQVYREKRWGVPQ